jgi:hypothetical protein
MIRLRFACGHGVEFSDSAAPVVICPTCGDARIAGVVAPPPRFTGCASGPLVTTRDLGAVVRPLAATPLRLTEKE